MSDRISLVVVESHQHVLEHVHFILRRRLRQKKTCNTNIHTWSMVHFDSHPDLACPNENIPAAACFVPRKEWDAKEEKGLAPTKKNLYDLLDTSRGGIAEWILPLVLAGGLKEVLWVKNEWCHQFQNGHYDFYVGACSRKGEAEIELDREVGNVNTLGSFLDLPDDAVVKSSLKHPYYIDDQSCVQEHEFLLKERMQLIVTEVDDNCPLTESCTSSNCDCNCNCDYQVNASDRDTEWRDWILDVCLDYFFCSNPFLVDLLKINAKVTNHFLKVVNEPEFRQKADRCESDLTQEEYREYELSLKTFNSLVKTLLSNFISMSAEDGSIQNCLEFEEIQQFYSEAGKGKILWHDLFEAINLLDEEIYTKNALVNMMLDALPNLSLPHTSIDDNNAMGAPYHGGRGKLELGASVQRKVEQFGNYIREEKWRDSFSGELKFKKVPMLITMARSSDDGFTPTALVEALQSAIMNEIHASFCVCSQANVTHHGVKKEGHTERCRLDIVFDYGEYEGSSLEESLS